MTVESNQRKYSYGSAATWTETACISGFTKYGYPELFSDLTVNLHHAPLNGVNEAYIDHNFSKEHLRFIRKYKLGRVLPETAVSGYCTFQKVAFDLKKLAEYDPQGTREFMESHGIQIADAPKQKPKNKSQRER